MSTTYGCAGESAIRNATSLLVEQSSRDIAYPAKPAAPDYEDAATASKLTGGQKFLSTVIMGIAFFAIFFSAFAIKPEISRPESVGTFGMVFVGSFIAGILVGFAVDGILKARNRRAQMPIIEAKNKEKKEAFEHDMRIWSDAYARTEKERKEKEKDVVLHVDREFSRLKLADSPDFSSIDLPDCTRPWLIGAYGEWRTGEELNKLDDRFTVIHDIVIRNDKNEVVANIDHLVFADGFAAQIDSKVWREAPTVIDDTVVSEKHARSCVACSLESSQLDGFLSAVVFSLSGKSVTELTSSNRLAHSFEDRKPWENKTVVEHISREDGAAVPIVFADSRDIAKEIVSLYESSKNGVGYRVLRADTVLNNSHLTIGG